MGDRVRVCARDDVRPGTAERFDIGELRLCIVRIGDDFYAIADRCSHADFSLSDGDVFPEDLEIECPQHGSAFSLTDGEPQTLPAVRPVATYVVELDGDDVYVVSA